MSIFCYYKCRTQTAKTKAFIYKTCSTCAPFCLNTQTPTLGSFGFDLTRKCKMYTMLHSQDASAYFLCLLQFISWKKKKTKRLTIEFVRYLVTLVVRLSARALLLLLAARVAALVHLSRAPFVSWVVRRRSVDLLAALLVRLLAAAPRRSVTEWGWERGQDTVGGWSFITAGRSGTFRCVTRGGVWKCVLHTQVINVRFMIKNTNTQGWTLYCLDTWHYLEDKFKKL